MKKFLFAFLIICILFSLIGCERHNKVINAIGEEPVIEEIADISVQKGNLAVSASVAPDQLEFSSLEEFFHTHKTVRSGGKIGELTDTATKVNFSNIEKFYLPTNIPDNFLIYNIVVYKDAVAFWYLHKEDLVSEDAIQEAMAYQRRFLFAFTV